MPRALGAQHDVSIDYIGGSRAGEHAANDDGVALVECNDIRSWLSEKANEASLSLRLSNGLREGASWNRDTRSESVDSRE